MLHREVPWPVIVAVIPKLHIAQLRGTSSEFLEQVIFKRQQRLDGFHFAAFSWSEQHGT